MEPELTLPLSYPNVSVAFHLLTKVRSNITQNKLNCKSAIVRTYPFSFFSQPSWSLQYLRGVIAFGKFLLSVITDNNSIFYVLLSDQKEIMTFLEIAGAEKIGKIPFLASTM